MNRDNLKELRRLAASVRQAARDKRTDAEQLSLIGRRPGNSAKECGRLLRRIAAA